ncbi:extracellular solute-binding protein [Nonomuraea dietziae]|uniref:extracellular solute-binding protein n=1 Tax=Nonomuraea dietziae TaxID=65515 RepID=UPI0031CF1CBC
MSVVIAGCGSGGSGSDKSTVTLWMYPVIADQAKNQAFWGKVEKDFETANPTIDVKIDQQPWDGRQEKITTALASRKGLRPRRPRARPDPAVRPAGHPRAARRRDRQGQGRLPVQRADRADGRRQALRCSDLPDDHRPIFNKKLFAEAGVTEVPDTLEELKAAAPKLAAKKVAVLDYPGKPEVSLNQSFYPILWANGGTVFAPDGKSVAFNGAPRACRACSTCST